MSKPAFDPSKPFDAPAKPKFDPNAAFQAGALPNYGATPGVLEALARGGEQGLTFGFGDEINGGLATLADAVTGKGNLDWESYLKNRDDSRAQFKAAEDAHPYVSTAGNVAGALLPALVTGGGSLAGTAGAEGAVAAAEAAAQAAPALSKGAALAKAGLTGAGYGALAGLGNSTADDVAGASKDVLTGALTGGVLGGAVHAGAEKFGSDLAAMGSKASDMAKGAYNALTDVESGSNLKNAVKLGADGMRLTGKAGGANLKNAEMDFYNGLQKDLDERLSQATGQQNVAIKSAADVPMGDYYDNATKLLDRAQEQYGSKNAAMAQDIQKLRTTLDDWYNGEMANQAGGEDVTFTPQSALTLKRIIGNLGSKTSAMQSAAGIENASPMVTDIGEKLANMLSSGVKAAEDPATASALHADLGVTGGFDGIKTVLRDSVPGLSESDDAIHQLLTAKEAMPGLSQTLNTTGPGVSSTEASDAISKFVNTLPADMQQATQDQLGKLSEARLVRNKIASEGLGHNDALGVVFGSLRSATYGGANMAGLAARSFYESSPEILKDLGSKVSSLGGDTAARLGNILTQVADKDQVGRNALLFSIQQNPAYRELLRKAQGQ